MQTSFRLCQLVTNAIQYADGGDVMFWLAQTDTSIEGTRLLWEE